MNPAVLAMLNRYPRNALPDLENALKEIIQEIALLGLWRSKFFEHAAFYGGTALRILYQLDRFSEDLDFSLLQKQKNFNFTPYLKAIEAELEAFGFEVKLEKKEKKNNSQIESAFLKANTLQQMLKIQTSYDLAKSLHRNAQLSIKIEVDTHPPGGFETEVKTLLQPIPFFVNSYQMPDLFAGKIHAILCRNWKLRVKGRDYYDLIWYIAHNIPVRLSHLEERLAQSGHWEKKERLSKKLLFELLKDRFAKLDVEAAKKDVVPFLKNGDAVAIWSQDFFVTLLDKIDVLP